MSRLVSAAIHIQGPAIRCAEVVREDASLDLQRCGHRTFDFDVTRALWDEEEGEPLKRVGRAAAEELEGTDASEVHLVVHPLDVFSFFTPISADLSERDRMRRVIQQAALVTGTRSPDSLRITPRSVRTAEGRKGEAIEWIHVLAVPREVKERMETLMAPLSVAEHDLLVSSEAAARLMGHAEAQEAPRGEADETPSYSLAVGQYPTHTEYALARKGEWHHAHATQEARAPENRAYYAVGFLNRIGVPLREVGRLFVYGSGADPEALDPFKTVFDRRPEPLDPFQVLRRFPRRPQEEATGSYVPCIGATLDPPSP